MPKEKVMTFSDHEIRVRAYRIWERSGKPEGEAEKHWRQALAELQAEDETGEYVPEQPGISALPDRSIAARAPGLGGK